MPKQKRKKKNLRLTNGMFVIGFTPSNDEFWLPPSFVYGLLAFGHNAMFDRDFCNVGNCHAIEDTITPIPNPTPGVIAKLKKKSQQWSAEDSKIAERRARKDNTFREKKINKEWGVNLVRKVCEEAFIANFDEDRKEDQRLIAERTAEVLEMIASLENKPRKAAKSRANER
jgi:hypothetical protein